MLVPYTPLYLLYLFFSSLLEGVLVRFGLRRSRFASFGLAIFTLVRRVDIVFENILTPGYTKYTNDK
jgi:hypothetical protein